MVCLHGFTDTWRTWELVLPALERHHDVLAPTLPGHAGGPAIRGEVTGELMADAVEGFMAEAGFGRAHLVGNSLGGYVALQLAARGRADSVVALAPAGGWSPADQSVRPLLELQRTMGAQARAAAPYAESIASTPDGRRRATQLITTNFEHLPADLVAHLICGMACCEGLQPLIDHALGYQWPLPADRISCPVRVIWGTDDRLLPWPSSAVRYRQQLPWADWVELEGVGHCPQLDVPLETAQLILDFAA